MSSASSHQALPNPMPVAFSVGQRNYGQAGVALTLADTLLRKWNVEAEREEIWEALQKCINELGPAIKWDLPGRLRLVAAVVQVTGSLRQVHVSLAAMRWILEVRNQNKQKQAQKFNALGLLGDLSNCQYASESVNLTEAEKTDLAAVSPERLEIDVVACASSISSHLDYDCLEDRLIHAVKSKDFDLVVEINKELKVLWKFLRISVPASRPALGDSLTQVPATTDDDTLRDLLANELAQDDTLEDMLSMVGEEEDLEDIATPTFQAPQQRRQVDPLPPAKRKAEVTGSMASPSSSAKRQQFAASQMAIVPSLSREVVPVSLSQISSGSRVSSRSSDLFSSDLVVRKDDRSWWSPEDEQRLIEGHRVYGKRWEFLRTQCQLNHKTGVQLKDKIRNLQKNGKI
jgi:hypothetical protein